MPWSQLAFPSGHQGPPFHGTYRPLVLLKGFEVPLAVHGCTWLTNMLLMCVCFLVASGFSEAAFLGLHFMFLLAAMRSHEVCVYVLNFFTVL